MNALLNAHVGGRLVAIIAAPFAIAARADRSLHAFAGTWFFGSMLVLGVTASILARFTSPELGILEGLEVAVRCMPTDAGASTISSSLVDHLSASLSQARNAH